MASSSKAKSLKIKELNEDDAKTELRVSEHGPDLCNCIRANECPYWKKILKNSNLSMARGKSIGPGKNRNIRYVGGSNELDRY